MKFSRLKRRGSKNFEALNNRNVSSVFEVVAEGVLFFNRFSLCDVILDLGIEKFIFFCAISHYGGDMGYRWGRKNRGRWPGRGPFSHLPPWQRPGWLMRMGWFYPPYPAPLAPSMMPPTQSPMPTQGPMPPETLPENIEDLISYRDFLREELKRVEEKIKRLKGTE